MKPGAPPHAAVPTGQNLRQRQQTTADVLTRPADLQEIPDGYAFRYPRSEAWERKLAAFRGLWQASCPHMRFEVEADDGSLWLRIRGPEGTKLWVENARYMLTSTLNPAPNLQNRLLRAWRLATSPLRVLPDFLILGAKKCGTTSLYAYLIAHPRIASAFRKEIHYFQACYHNGPLWYRSFFPTRFQTGLARLRGGPLLTGEATPDYLFHADVPPRVRALLPRARLIALLRNPIDRAYSYYNHNRRSGIENLAFEEAVDREEERLAEEERTLQAGPELFRYSRENLSYKTRGLYLEQLETWWAAFPKDQLLVLATEDLEQRPQETLRTALDFLGLPYAGPAEFRKLNAAPYPDMDPRTRARLAEWFRPHNERLYAALGRDLHW